MIEKLRADLDIRLLRTLYLLLTESSVSRVALLLGQSQPAVSASLKRLRLVLEDPLLVRGAGGRLVPSDRGAQLVDVVGRLLADFDRLFEARNTFDPGTTRRQAHIASTNCLGALLIPRIVELIRAQAPFVDIDFSARTNDDEPALLRRLESGDIDVVIGTWPSPSEVLRIAPLMETDIVCMMRPEHPLARETSLTLDRYLTLDHISPSSPSQVLLSPIDGRLAELGYSRRVAVAVPEYAIVPAVLSRNDLVFTTGLPYADHLASVASFSVVPAPKELGKMPFYMLWHERAHHSPFERWLRGIIRTAGSELAGMGGVRAARAPHKRPMIASI